MAEWMKSNRLAFSISKTNFVLFHSKRLKPYKSLNLKIDGVNIQEVFQFSSFRQHIKNSVIDGYNTIIDS